MPWARAITATEHVVDPVDGVVELEDDEGEVEFEGEEEFDLRLLSTLLLVESAIKESLLIGAVFKERRGPASADEASAKMSVWVENRMSNAGRNVTRGIVCTENQIRDAIVR